MPADESAGDRTEDATERRKQREREQGRVAKSRDLAAAAVLLGAMLLLKYGGHTIFRWLHACMKRFLQQDLGNVLPPDGLDYMPLAYEWLTWTACALAPFLLALFLIAWIANVMQFGFLLSADPLTPDLNKIDPVNGLKRIFSLRGLMTLVMNLLKLGVVITVAYLTLRVEIPGAVALTQMDPGEMLVYCGHEVATLGIRLSAVFLVLGIADFAYQRYQKSEDMKMTKQEVKQEMKDDMGDPQIRARRRQIQRQMAMQRMMQDVPQAEVVVRNPTHFAVAIRYKPGMEAPVVVAKGADKLAQRIIEIAIKNNVPCWQAPALARKLYKVEIGEQIPAALFPALAEILSHVLKGEKLAEYRRAMAEAA